MTSAVLTCRTRPELARVKTPRASGMVVATPTPPFVAPALARHQLHVRDALPRIDVHEQPVEHALPVLAARVGDRDAVELLHALRLVDVSVQADHRPVLRDRVARRRAADGDHLEPG